MTANDLSSNEAISKRFNACEHLALKKAGQISLKSTSRCQRRNGTGLPAQREAPCKNLLTDSQFQGPCREFPRNSYFAVYPDPDVGLRQLWKVCQSPNIFYSKLGFLKNCIAGNYGAVIQPLAIFFQRIELLADHVKPIR